MPKQDPYLTRLVGAVHGEVESDAEKIAEALKGELDPNYTNPGAIKYLDWWKANWNDVAWRQEQLDRVGPEHFLNTSYEAFGLADMRPDFTKLAQLNPTPEQMSPQTVPTPPNPMMPPVAEPGPSSQPVQQPITLDPAQLEGFG